MCGLYLVWGSIWWYLRVVGWCPLGVLAACVVVCAVCALVFCSVGVPCVGSLCVGTRRGVK